MLNPLTIIPNKLLTFTRDTTPDFSYNAHAPRTTDYTAGGTTMFIRDVIRNREPYSLRASASVLEAAEFMAQRKIGAVCVLDEEGKLFGVFSERDILNRVIVPRRDPAELKLGDVASPLRGVIRCDETPAP